MALSRLSPRARRTILEQLPRERLADITGELELDVADRRSSDSHVDAIVRRRSLDFRRVLEMLKRDELQAACGALDLDTGGREKATLVARLLGEAEDANENAPSSPAAMPLAERTSSTSTYASTSSITPPPMSIRSSGALKSSLRRFVLDLAGGLRGADAPRTFVSRLLACFDWPNGVADGASSPAALAIVEHGERVTRNVALLWKERRVLVEVVKHDVMLDFAWKELLHVCLQLDPVPQYVLLTNQRDLQLYDLARDRNAPRLSIPLDDLPKQSEAFPFLARDWVPGITPKIINNSKVSREVAELVANLYRSLKDKHAKDGDPAREREVVQFTLQCILTMFAEDIGMLPQEYFTSLLYEGSRAGDIEERLRELFRLMSTKDVPGERAVPFFNGGLFTNPITLPLDGAQLAALTKASEANWTYVDPHIFGSVFQGIMNDAERHKSGAHYTAHEDIMRVVGPTIVDPWRQRIRAAKTLGELLDVREDLFKFRVLDPACGSGNFLYVAFRELYRLDTELLARIREFPSTQARVTWGACIQTSNFFGIDINPFAVELAKVTLNIAKKIAFEERRELAADLNKQMELEVDPSLPLDNLDKNIVCADALFTDWPEADSIVSNPPFLGDRKIRSELGPNYIDRLQATSGVDGVVDLCCYWFRRAHDRLPTQARAGLIATSGVRIGKAREASLDYVVKNGGTITNAVSSRLWPGDAALNVSMVNWTKGAVPGPHDLIVEGRVYSIPRVPTHLQLHADVSATRKIHANDVGTTMGAIFGHEAFRASGASEFPLDLRGKSFVRPVATGDDLLRGVLTSSPDYCLYLCDFKNEREAASGAPGAFAYLKKHVYPLVKARADSGKETKHYAIWLRSWWHPHWPRDEFFAKLSGSRMVVCSSPQARPIFAFISSKFVPTNTMQIFAFDDDYSFGLIQSGLHWVWTKAKGGKVTERIRYTADVWTTFPWPQESNENEIAAVAAAGRNLRAVRDRLMKENGWSLRALYQAAEVAGPHPLKDAQAALDDAVRKAYGMPADQEATEFLLELNELVAEDEAAGHKVRGPGLPEGLDKNDPRWMSDDCIEPPPLEKAT